MVTGGIPNGVQRAYQKCAKGVPMVPRGVPDCVPEDMPKSVSEVVPRCASDLGGVHGLVPDIDPSEVLKEGQEGQVQALLAALLVPLLCHRKEPQGVISNRRENNRDEMEGSALGRHEAEGDT